MRTRIELQTLLEELFESKNVYFQPSTNTLMKYPAIKYSKEKIDSKNADNTKYLIYARYSITVIDKKPDNPAILKLLALPHCGHDRSYKADGLYHETFTLYF